MNFLIICFWFEPFGCVPVDHIEMLDLGDDLACSVCQPNESYWFYIFSMFLFRRTQQWLKWPPKTVWRVIKAGVSKGLFAKTLISGDWKGIPQSLRIGIFFRCHRPLIGGHLLSFVGACSVLRHAILVIWIWMISRFSGLEMICAYSILYAFLLLVAKFSLDWFYKSWFVSCCSTFLLRKFIVLSVLLWLCRDIIKQQVCLIVSLSIQGMALWDFFRGREPLATEGKVLMLMSLCGCDYLLKNNMHHKFAYHW